MCGSLKTQPCVEPGSIWPGCQSMMCRLLINMFHESLPRLASTSIYLHTVMFAYMGRHLWPEHVDTASDLNQEASCKSAFAIFRSLRLRDTGNNLKNGFEAACQSFLAMPDQLHEGSSKPKSTKHSPFPDGMRSTFGLSLRQTGHDGCEIHTSLPQNVHCLSPCRGWRHIPPASASQLNMSRHKNKGLVPPAYIHGPPVIPISHLGFNFALLFQTCRSNSVCAHRSR